MGVSLDTVMILAYAKTAQGGWRFWPFQLKLLFDSSDRVRSAGKKKSRVHVRNAVHLSPVFPGTHMRSGFWIKSEAAGLCFVFCVHIRFCGYGGYRFRFYSESLGKAPSNQGLLPLSFGASLWLGMPSLRSCSVGPPPSAIHGRGRLTRHPCRVAHCAEPALGLSMGRAPQKQSEAAYRPACLFKRTHSPVGACSRKM
jgi:hypothetical protein